MTGLTKMPTEIIQQIAELVPVEDLENFTSASKILFLASQKPLRKHRKRIRKYRLLQCPEYPEEKRDCILDGSIPRLLSKVLDKPRIGAYVKEARLGHLIGEDERIIYRSKDDQGKNTRCKSQVDKFTTAMRACQFASIFVQSHDNDGDDDDEILDCASEETLFVLLLHYPPNLTSLNMKWNSTRYETFVGMLSRLPSTKTGVLRKLQSIQLAPLEGVEFDIVDIRWFSGLPSVKSIETQGISDGTSFGNPTHPPKVSNVTKFVLDGCALDTKSVCHCLQAFQNL